MTGRDPAATLAATMLLALVIVNPSLAAQEIRMNQEELSLVGRGEVILREVPEDSAAGTCFEAIGMIDARPKQVYGVLSDLVAYSDFMPNVSSVRILEQSPGHAVADYVLRLPLGKVKKYRLRMTFHRGGESFSIRWKMLDRPDLAEKETIRDTSGYWSLQPYAGRSDRTLALYHVYTDPGPVPAGLGWIVDTLSRNSLPETLLRTRTRVAERYR